MASKAKYLLETDSQQVPWRKDEKNFKRELKAREIGIREAIIKVAYM